MKHYKNRTDLDEQFKELYQGSPKCSQFENELYLKLRAVLINFAETCYFYGVDQNSTEHREKLIVESMLKKYPFLKEFPNWRLLQYVVKNHNNYAKLTLREPKIIQTSALEFDRFQLDRFTYFHSNFPEFCFSDVFFYNYSRFDLTGYLPNKQNFFKDTSISNFTYFDLPDEICDAFVPVMRHAKNGYVNTFRIMTDKQTQRAISSAKFEDDEDDERLIETTEIKLYNVVDYIDEITPYLRINFKEKKYMNLQEGDDFEFYFDIFKACLLIDLGFEFGSHNVFPNKELLIWQYLFTSSPYNVYNDAKKLFLAYNFFLERDFRALWFGRPFKDKVDLADILFLTPSMSYVAIKVHLNTNLLESSKNAKINFTDPTTINRMEANLISEQATFKSVKIAEITGDGGLYYSPKRGMTQEWLLLLKQHREANTTYVDHFPLLEINPPVEENIKKLKTFFTDPNLDELGKDIQRMYSRVNIPGF
jgi:hypothetical protein